MGVNDVDSENEGSRKQFREARRDLTRAAASIEYPGFGRERIAANKFNFLRPNGLRLCGQVAHHGLVGHLFCLWIEIGQLSAPIVSAELSSIRNNCKILAQISFRAIRPQPFFAAVGTRDTSNRRSRCKV